MMSFYNSMRWMDMMDAETWLGLVPVARNVQEDWLTAKVQRLYDLEAEAMALLEPEEWICD